MKVLFKKIISTLIVVLLASTTIAYASTQQGLTKAKLIIQKAFHNKATIIKTFKAPKNLIGFVIKGQDNKPSIIYVDKEGGYLFLGTLVNNQGKDLTTQDQAKYIQPSKTISKLPRASTPLPSRPSTATATTPPISTATPNLLIAAQKNTHWFEQGNPKAPHQMYVIAEPNCSACHYFYESVKPYIAKGLLKIRWIMVAFLKPSSFGKVAAIISAKTPATAFDNNEAKFNVKAESGGITPLTSATTAVEQDIISNLKFMKKHQFNSTPILIFKNTSGKIRVLKGAVQKDEVARLIKMIGTYQ